MAQEGRDEKGRFIEGNTEAEYTEDEMKAIIVKYCVHLAEGYSKESFIDCEYHAIERHIAKYPSVYDTEKRLIKAAERKGRFWWEERGKKGLMVGKRFNATVWIFNMKNRYEEWKDVMHRKNEDKVDANVKHTGTINVKFGGDSIHTTQEPTKDT